MNYTQLLVGTILATTLTLSGCSSTFEQNEQITGPAISEAQYKEQKMKLVDLNKYVNRGSIDLDLLPQSEYGNSTTNTRGSAKYVYDLKSNSYVFAVTHALAGVLLKVKSDPKIGGIELTTSEGKKYLFNNEVEFVRAVHIPVSRLPYIIMGINLGDETDVKYDENGHLKTMSLQGWYVRYYEYANFGDYILPKRLELRNSNVGTVRIVVDSWEHLL